MEGTEIAVANAAWRYCVVCEDGAYVRSGLELSSRHLYTVPFNSVVEVTERCVNNQGLARLRTADGWISEMLNPLSGQVPMDRPLKYRVVYGGGALVRSGVELSSSVVGTIPAGAAIVVTEKRFSNTPSYRCVPRFKLRDGSGWISMRINSPPPEDHPVVLLEGLAADGEEGFSFYPSLPMADAAGALISEGAEDEQDDDDHQQQHEDEMVSTPASVLLLRRPVLNSSSSHSQHGSGGNSSWTKVVADSDKIARAFTDISLSTSDGDAKDAREPDDVSCLVCFSSQRTATFVHGETGHIACCLECARVLKGRGDPCPVCRLPVDSVIQHFWA